MNDDELLEALAQTGVESRGAAGPWSASASLLSALDAIGRDGGTALVKIDGGRADGRAYTVVVSGGRLGEEAFRRDGAELEVLLRDAIGFYVEHARRGPRQA